MGDDAAPRASVYAVPAFRHVWLARVLSKGGDTLTEIALAVFAFRVSGNNTLAYGGILAVALATPVVFGWIATGQVDRVHKKHLMVAMDLARCALVLSIPLVHTLWWAYVAVIGTQACASFYNPSIRAILPETVSPDRIFKANAALSNGLSLVQIPAYLVATEVMLHTSLIYAFSLDALSFVAAAAAIGTLQLPREIWRPVRSLGRRSFWGEMREGIQYHRETPAVRALLVMYMILVVGALAANVQLAAWVAHSLHGPEADLGPIMAAVALGALVLSSVLTRRELAPKHYRAAILTGCGLMGVSMLAASHVVTYPLMLALSVILGAGNVLAIIPLNAWLQRTVPTAMRGRVYAARGMGLGLAGAAGQILAGLTAVNGPGVTFTFYWMAGFIFLSALVGWLTLAPAPLSDKVSTSAVS